MFHRALAVRFKPMARSALPWRSRGGMVSRPAVLMPSFGSYGRMIELLSATMKKH